MPSLDLRVSLAYRTKSASTQVPAEGWYIDASENEGYDQIIDRVQVSDESAELIARAFDTALGRPNAFPIKAAVDRTSRYGRQNRQRRIETLEQSIVNAKLELERLRSAGKSVDSPTESE